jgi:hypothetical protein
MECTVSISGLETVLRFLDTSVAEGTGCIYNRLRVNDQTSNAFANQVNASCYDI